MPLRRCATANTRLRCTRGAKPSCIPAAEWARARAASADRRPSSCLAGILSMRGRLSIPLAYPQSRCAVEMTLSETGKCRFEIAGSRIRPSSSKEEIVRRLHYRIPEIRQGRLPRAGTFAPDSQLHFLSKAESDDDELIAGAGGQAGVWLRVTMLNSAVLSFNTIVRAILDSLSEACHTFSASRRIIAFVSSSRTSDSNVSSAEIDWVGLFGSMGLLSIPRANS